MASEINFDNLNYDQLNLLKTKLFENIDRARENARIIKIDNDRNEDFYVSAEAVNLIYHDNKDKINSEMRTHNNASDSQVRNTNEIPTRLPVMRMSCPPPPPPVKASKTKLEEDILTDNNPKLSRSYSAESEVVPIPKKRTKLEQPASSIEKPALAPKPHIGEKPANNLQKQLLFKYLADVNGTGVTRENKVLTSKVLEEFNRLRVVDGSNGTLKRITSQNNGLTVPNKTDTIINSTFTENVNRAAYLTNKLSMRNARNSVSKEPFSVRPELPPKPKPRKVDAPIDMMQRITIISKNAIGNLQENEISGNTSIRSDTGSEKSLISNTAQSNNYNDIDEPIYDTIADSIYNSRSIYNMQPVYIESEVFNTLRRRDKTQAEVSRDVDTPPPLPPKPSTLSRANILSRSDGETDSEASSEYSYRTRIYAPSESRSVYYPCYPPREGSVLDEFDSDGEKRRKHKDALQSINYTEKIYVEQLEKIYGIYRENNGKADDDQLKALFGDIKGLFDFHKDFFKQFRSCHTLPQLGKLVIRMEHGFDIYRQDKWCKSTESTSITSSTQSSSIFVPYQNWSENHLSMYNHLLNQLMDDKDPDIKMASTIITELIRQCEAVSWLKDIKNFPKIQSAGKYLLKDTFHVKINNMDRGVCDVVLMEKYILCISPESKHCFCYFNTSKISMARNGPKSKKLFIEKIFKDKKMTLKSNDSNVIETWLNRYLCLIHR